MNPLSFIDTEESAISSPEPEIVVSDEPAVGLEESKEEEELPLPVDVQRGSGRLVCSTCIFFMYI